MFVLDAVMFVKYFRIMFLHIICWALQIQYIVIKSGLTLGVTNCNSHGGHNLELAICISYKYSHVKTLNITSSGCCIYSIPNHCQTLLGCVYMEIPRKNTLNLQSEKMHSHCLDSVTLLKLIYSSMRRKSLYLCQICLCQSLWMR